MTKSQNTKNEQHCIKQNEKSFIQKDLSLTELWQKGELPSGEYYIIDDLGLHTTDRYYPSHGFGAELPQYVLGRVPSYEEWRAKLKENKLLEKFCEEFNALNVSKENQRLKELLKECVELMDNTKLMNIDVYMQRKKDVLNSINQVLG